MKRQNKNGNKAAEDQLAAAEKAVAETQERIAAAQASLEQHDQERQSLSQESERLTAQLDEATLSGRTKELESLAARLGVLRERAASLDRTRGPRISALKAAEDQLAAARKEAARQEQATLIAQKSQLNGKITEVAKELARLLEEAEAVQGEIDNLAALHQLDRPHGRLLLPRELIRSQGAEVLRNAIDETRAFGLGPGAAGRIVVEGS